MYCRLNSGQNEHCHVVLGYLHSVVKELRFCIEISTYSVSGDEPNWEMSRAGHNFLKYGVQQKYLDRPFKVVHMRE